MPSVNPAEGSQVEAELSATLLTVGRWTSTVHAPASDVQLFTIAIIKATLEIVVVRDTVNRIRVVLGPPAALTAGQDSHDCQ